MKRLLCLSLLLLVCAAPARADIIPKDMKAIYISLAITNLADYPDHVFIQLETFGGSVRIKQLIGPSGSVNKGYKFHQLEILAIPKDYFDSHGGLDGIADKDLLSSKLFVRSMGARLEAGQRLVPRSSKLAGKTVSYRITSLADGVITLEQTQEQTYDEHPNHYPVNLFAYGFGITFAAELFLFLLLVRFAFRVRKPGALRCVMIVFVAQAATLPLLWFMITRYDLMGSQVMVAAESFAVGVESVIYRILAKLTWKQAFIAALLCNALSYTIGLMA